MKIKFYLIIVCFVLLFAGTGVANAQNDDPIHVSLLQVIANPDKYDGQDILLIGYLHLEFEGDGLWLHKEDYDHAIFWNTIWVDTNHEMNKQKNQLNNHYVIIRGTFNAKDHGHGGLFSGSLTNITRCEIWPDPKIPKSQHQ